MNVAFFLTPKQSVVWVPVQAFVRQALELIEQHRFSAVPLLNEAGHYVGTVTEGDILWHLLRDDRPWREVADTTPVRNVGRRMANHPVRIDAGLDVLVARTVAQSFVPVIDDRDIFVGIVRREVIIEHCARLAGILPGGQTSSVTPAAAADLAQ